MNEPLVLLSTVVRLIRPQVGPKVNFLRAAPDEMDIRMEFESLRLSMEGIYLTFLAPQIISCFGTVFQIGDHSVSNPPAEDMRGERMRRVRLLACQLAQSAETG